MLICFPMPGEIAYWPGLLPGQKAIFKALHEMPN